MSKILFITSLLVAGAAWAESKPIPYEQLENYKVGATQALDQLALSSGFYCVNAEGRQVPFYDYPLKEVVSSAGKGWLDSSGSQPALIFADGNNWRKLLTIVTNSDNSKIVSVSIAYQNLTAVNHGSLIAPLVTDDYITTSTITCSTK